MRARTTVNKDRENSSGAGVRNEGAWRESRRRKREIKGIKPAARSQENKNNKPLRHANQVVINEGLAFPHCGSSADDKAEGETLHFMNRNSINQ